MNILSYDIEEWALAKVKGIGSEKLYGEYDRFLSRILDMLDQYGIRATFFCTGQMAEFFPHIVKLIYLRGHEVGCHSYQHTWMNKMTEVEAREDTHRAVDLIEQCIGEKVESYRAPAFSIGEKNIWMFDIFAENGIVNDSSVFPAKRDFGGFPEFGNDSPTLVKHGGIEIREFPIPVCNILGSLFAYSGGGYMRLFPQWFIRKKITKEEYALIYLHIADLLTDTKSVMSRKEYEDYFKESGTLLARYKRYFKANYGKKNAWVKMENFISTISFECIASVSEKIDWQSASIYNI